MTLRLFNPENDLALAADIDRYTAPAVARRLALAGQALPMWLAESDTDAVLVTDEAGADEAMRLKERYGLKGMPVMSAAGADYFEPWGWSRAARRRFISAGADPAALPSDEALARHRSLSSRLTTVELCRALGLEPPVIATTAAEAVAAVAANAAMGRDSFIKMPWSCSGRGVVFTAGMGAEAVSRRAADFIRAQGAVTVEPDRRRQADFAVLYRISGGRACFHALSLFEADARGAYRGNLIASDEAITARLGVDPMPWASRMAEALTAVVARDYTGWAGVDMVVDRDGDIYPCIELNLRATMGVVAAAMRRVHSKPALLMPSPAGIVVEECD